MSYLLVIISIPLFLILIFLSTKHVLRKFVNSTAKQGIIAGVITLLISPVLYYVLTFTWLFYISYYPQKEFNANNWNNHVEERYEMSKHIIDSEMLIGKSKQEVFLLLGNQGESSNKIIYNLGIPPGLRIDHELLEVTFKNNKVHQVLQLQS